MAKSLGSRIRSRAWLLAVVLAFGAVFSASLTFEYVEGDDASMIAFHGLGRHADLQPPYSVYHSMMDTCLGLLPSREGLLRSTAISWSAISALTMALLILTLAFDWLRPIAGIARLPSTLALLLAVPELFYLGLVLTPSLTAMSLVLMAHLLARRAIQPLYGRAGGKHSHFPLLIMAAALFGAGASFRWDTITYGAIIAAELALSPLQEEAGPDPLRQRLGRATLWGILALLSFFAFIGVSGYLPEDVLRVARSGAAFSASQAFSASAVAAIQSLLTPGFALLTALGFWSLVRRIPRLAIIVALGVLLITPWMVTGVPKYLLVALPGLATAFVLGFFRAWAASTGRAQAVIRLMIVLSLGLPWVVGFRVTLENSSWGPGFELRPFTSSLPQGLRPAFGPGAAAPTPEGPRPVFGHVHVLLGGRWRNLLHNLAMERSQVVETAAETRLPILRLRGSNGFDTAEFVAHGFLTRDPASRQSRHVAGFLERRFQGPRGLRITYLRAERPDSLESDAVLEGLSRSHGDRVILLGYPSDLKHLYRCAPGALEPIGPMSGFLSLEELRRSSC